MEEKKKGMPPILIVILSVLGTCLVGFCVWYGVNYSKGEEKPNNPVDNPPVVNPGSSSDLTADIIDFPQKSDDEAVIGRLTDFLSESIVKTNFKNLEFTKNGNDIVFNCEHYIDKTVSCGEVKVVINNDFNLTIDTGYEASKEGIYDNMYSAYDILGYNKILKVNNNYIVYNDSGKSLDINTITIYNKSNRVYTNNLVKSFYSYGDNFVRANTIPTIVNNVLHFIQQPEDYAVNRVKYNTIDLSKDKIEVKLVKEFTGYISGEK